MPVWRTSETHPLEIASVAVPGTGGTIGITFCPGKTDAAAASGAWRRSLKLDLATIVHWGAEALITLIEQKEFTLLKVEGLEAAVRDTGLPWFHIPIVDVSIPDARFERGWAREGPVLRRILRRNGKVVLHCRGGLGRAGIVAARLLVELGTPAAEAIAQVRARRPGAIETLAQEAYVRALQPLPRGMP